MFKKGDEVILSNPQFIDNGLRNHKGLEGVILSREPLGDILGSGADRFEGIEYAYWISFAGGYYTFWVCEEQISIKSKLQEHIAKNYKI